MWHSGIVLSIQRLKVCHFKNVDEGKDHYVKWNKPSIERQVLKVVICMWSLKWLTFQKLRGEYWLLEAGGNSGEGDSGKILEVVVMCVCNIIYCNII